MYFSKKVLQKLICFLESKKWSAKQIVALLKYISE